MELFGLAWIGAAIGAGAIASSKGRSGFGYFVLGILMPIVGLLIAIGMAPIEKPAAGAMSAKGGKDFILCTGCGRPHRADVPLCPRCGKMNLGPDLAATKKCPACAETILAEARKCKHCGETIPELPATTSGPRANWGKVDEVEKSLNQRR